VSTPIGQMNGGGHPPDKVAKRTHHVYIEELIAHLAGQHACSQISDYVQAVQAEAIENRAKVSPAVPGLDGYARINVEVDSGAILSEPHHRHVIERMHREHTHDYPQALDIEALHRDWTIERMINDG
jgi:hypothetical protein